MMNGNILEEYNAAMQQGLMDKLYFLDYCNEVHNIVDFGAADGSLIELLYNRFGNTKRYFAVDNSPEMLDILRYRFQSNPCVRIVGDMNDLPSIFGSDRTAVILSSVLHEIYSYGTDLRQFEKIIFGGNFAECPEYIFIRDMSLSRTANRPIDINDLLRLRTKANPSTLQEYTDFWGEIHSDRDMLHYLLKYRYEDNFDRENRENYFSLPYERLLEVVGNNYYFVHHEHYVLPYLRNVIYRDFGITVRDNTHVKLILRRKQ